MTDNQQFVLTIQTEIEKLIEEVRPTNPENLNIRVYETPGGYDYRPHNPESNTIVAEAHQRAVARLTPAGDTAPE